MKTLVLPIAGAALGIGVALSGQEPPTATPAPRIGFSAWGETCTEEAMPRSPEVWTRKDDARRIVGGRYVEPLALNCVLNAYRQPALERAAAKGDPVAHLALAYQLIQTTDDPCRQLRPIERELTAAYAAPRSAYPFADETAEVPAARVPEAALVLSQVYALCGRPAAAETMRRRATALGIDPRAVAAEIDG